MGFFQSISEFFEEIFNKNSPEVQNRLLLRKIASSIVGFTPALFKDGMLIPNFAEAVRVIYVNSTPIFEILSNTISSPEPQKAQRYEAQLVVTGFGAASQKLLNEIAYDARRADFENTAFTSSQIFDRQRKKLDKVISELSGEQFQKIDETLTKVRQLSDLCKFNYLIILQAFDSSFVSSDPNYKPRYHDVPIENMGDALEDLYYLIKGLKLDDSCLNAVVALKQLFEGVMLSQNEHDEIMGNMKNLAYIINHVLSDEKLKRLICYCKKNERYVPKAASYHVTAKENFERILQARFQADEQRIKTQMNDDFISGEVFKLFGQTPLIALKGYGDELNEDLLKTGLTSFLWIVPMQVLKTFIYHFFTENIRTLLNNIIIEGFFNNQQYKSEFSADVYAALNIGKAIEDFEDSFSDGKSNSVAVIHNLISEGRGNPDFMRRLDMMIKNINNQANQILASEANALNKIYKHIVDLIADVKKPSSELISNLKVLLLSSRNKDNTDTLERQYPKWEVFFKIMKNYVILNS